MTTPKGSNTCKPQYSDTCTETVFFKRTYSRNKLVDAPRSSMEESFSLHPGMLADTSNLCLVELSEGCDISRDDAGMKGEKEVRKPLAEKTSNRMTPRNVALERVASPGTPSDGSVMKFASGVSKFDPSTPTGRRDSSLAKKFDTFATPSPTILASNKFRETTNVPRTQLSSALRSEPTSRDQKLDSPSETHGESSLVLGGTSFEIHGPLGMKKNSPRSDLLAEEMSFLTRMSDDSFLENNREHALDDDLGGMWKSP